MLVDRVIPAAPASDEALLAIAVAGEAAAQPWLMAKKKKRKAPATPAKAPGKAPARKKAAAKPPAKKRTGRKFSPVEKRKGPTLSQRAEKYFSGWTAMIAREVPTGTDWARLSILFAGLLVILFYGFNAGGYFPVRRSYGELWVLYLVVLGLLFGWQTRGRMSKLGIAETGVFAAFSLWLMLSVTWSLTPSDSYTEFLRSILYMAGFGVFYLYMARREWLSWLGHLFVSIVLIVAIASLLGKIFPDQKPFDFDARLSNPITYWNTMALFMIMGFPMALRVVTDRATNIFVRCYYGAALFLFTVVLYFTFSRSAYPVFLVAVGVYVLLAVSRLRAVMQAGVALFWAAVSVGICYLALPGMVKLSPELDERVGQGHWLGVVVIVLLLAAIGSQIAIWKLEDRVKVTAELGRKIALGLAGVGVVFTVLLGGVYIAKKGNPVTQIVDQITSTEAKKVASSGSAEERLFSTQSERFQEYRVSLDIFKEHPLNGTGAATWSVSWLQDRPGFTDEAGTVYDVPVKNGHSILFDALAELGIVGAGLLVAFFVLFIVVSIQDLRFFGKTRHREIYGAVFAACLALAIHAQFDWDWQMPVVFLSFFMFAGALLRYGMISRAVAAGESEEELARAVHEGWTIRRVFSWNWAVGVLCLIAMALIILFLFATTRTDNANQQAREIAGQIQQGNVTLGGKYVELEKSANSASSYDIWKVETDPLILKAMAAQGQGRLDEAEQLLLQARDKEPHNYKIYLNLARLYVSEKKVDNAVWAIWNARRLNPLESREIGPAEQSVRDIGGQLFDTFGPGGVLIQNPNAPQPEPQGPRPNVEGG